jgi:hypothetical protein
MSLKRIFLLVAVIAMLASTPVYIWSQEDAYEPYRPEEFPEWAHTARRFETIFFGALPIAFLFGSLGFDMYAYTSNGFTQEYLPLFLGNSPEKEQFTQDTMIERIGISISLSLVIAIIDLIIDTHEKN